MQGHKGAIARTRICSFDRKHLVFLDAILPLRIRTGK